MIKIHYYYEDPIDSKLITDTFKAAYGIEMDYKVFEWRFLSNPYGEKIYINYLLIDGVLAAYYAVSPIKISNNGKIEKMALSCMTMTHPNYQGNGYFKILATDLYKKLSDDGFIGVLGFANQNSHYGFRKNLGWNDLAILNLFQVKKDEYYNFHKKYYNEYSFTNCMLNENHISNSENLNCSNCRIIPLRGKSFLEWRLLNSPTYRYYALEIVLENKLKGMLFYKFYGSTIDIMEFYYDNDPEYSTLINGISYLIDKHECDINIWSNLHGDEHLILEKFGFKESNFVSYFGVIPFLNKKEFSDIHNWHYRFLDSDVF